MKMTVQDHMDSYRTMFYEHMLQYCNIVNTIEKL